MKPMIKGLTLLGDHLLFFPLVLVNLTILNDSKCSQFQGKKCLASVLQYRNYLNISLVYWNIAPIFAIESVLKIWHLACWIIKINLG